MVSHPLYQSPQDLVLAAATGVRLKYLFFWGHQPESDKSIGRGCLSQWWPSSFKINDVVFPTTEHWMMVSKARLFDDDAAAEKILAANSPGEAKAIGRAVRNFDEAIWERKRNAIVESGNYAKFSQNIDLRTYLIGTGSRILVEASPLDRVWGIGLDANHASADDPNKWRGLNLLGFALMNVRDRLRSEST